MILDTIDLKILEELEDDPRQSVQQLARKAGMKRTTAKYRLNRLISNGVLSFICVAKSDILEYQIPLGIGINVSPGKTETVAQRLAALPAVQVVNLVGGRYGIFVWALLKDRRDLTCFVSEELGHIQNITSIEMMLAFNWIWESWRYFKPRVEASVENVKYSPNELDTAIIRALQQAPRQSIADLARSAGCSKPVAKARLENLMNSGIIHFVSNITPEALGYNIQVVVLVKSTPDQTNAVADHLSMQNFVRHVSLTTGYWQVLAVAQFRDNAHMHGYLTETLAATSGVTDFEVVTIMKTLKFSMNFVDIM